MGLDIYFMSVKKSNTGNPEKDREIEFSELGEDNCIHELYFRKINFLLPFFSYGENDSYKLVTKEDVKLLIKTCREVLKHKDAEFSSNSLPNMSGFFFGSTVYDEDYYEKVKYVLSEFSQLFPKKYNHTDDKLDWDTESLYMYCSW